MKILAINGSPRKNWNTATLLVKALEGAASAGAETELVHLYDLNYKGCISCFACKTKGGTSYGKCAVQDELAAVLKKALDADAILLGSPIYLSAVTGAMRSFMERLMFPNIAYTNPYTSLAEKKIKTGFIYTMNIPEERFNESPLKPHLEGNQASLELLFGSVEPLYCFDTLQFTDYSKYVSDLFDPDHKAARRRDVFPEDCRKAFELGVRLVS
ncbi:MAG TPA: flavodoxin family protein [Spirochaetota bacterium]|nr:flavodoxin family protein [Spirochaetota bacterium]